MQRWRGCSENMSGACSRLQSGAFAARAAGVFGPAIWLAMSLAVIPLATGRPLAVVFTIRRMFRGNGTKWAET
jgi:hypothetical protein